MNIHGDASLPRTNIVLSRSIVTQFQSEPLRMRTRTVFLGLFMAMTIVFASIAVVEYSVANWPARVTSTYAISTTVIEGTTTLTAFPTSELYDVTFNESRGCGGYIDEWGVQLANLTITEPPNLSLGSIQSNGFYASGRFNLTTIVFALPDGTYAFTIYPTEYLHPAANNSVVGDIRGSGGIITVNGSDVTVDTISGEICV